MAKAVSFGDIQAVLDAAIRATGTKWHLRDADAEDFAQDVRLAVLRREQAALSRFRGEGAFTYFCRIATRVAIDRLRHERGRRSAGRSAAADHFCHRTQADRPRTQPVSDEPNADSAAMREHLVRALTRVFDTLNADERMLLTRRFVRAASANAIAHAIGSSRSSAARRVQALLDEIRDMLVLVSVSPDEVKQVLAQCRVDTNLLDNPGDTGSTLTRNRAR